jgi:hypothetical protein
MLFKRREEKAMRTVVVVFVVTVLTTGVLMVTPPGGFADEPITITGEVREVQLGETRLQLIPTNRGCSSSKVSWPTIN